MTRKPASRLARAKNTNDGTLKRTVTFRKIVAGREPEPLDLLVSTFSLFRFVCYSKDWLQAPHKV